MDVKGLAWIGNIYEKFEAMCLEMEEVMYEDTVKYVENQVQTVGATAKRFYSDVMLELHPDAYIDPVKVAAADLSLNPYAHSEMKLRASAKKDASETDMKMCDDSKVITGKTRTGAYIRPTACRKANSKAHLAPVVPQPIAPISETVSSFSQFKRSRELPTNRVGVDFPAAHLEGRFRNTAAKTSKSVDITLPVSRATVSSPATHATVSSPATATTLPAASTELNQDDSISAKINSSATDTIRSAASSDVNPPDSASTSFNSPATATILSVVSPGMNQADATRASSFGGLSTEACDARTCTRNVVVSLDEGTIYSETDHSKDIVTAHQERLVDCCMDAAKNDDAIDSEVEIAEPFNDSMLEETCVMVESDKFHFVPRKGGHKSYKKRLREAFSSNTRLTRKEYEQLTAKYVEEESDQENSERVGPDRPAGSRSKTLQAHGSESEWELL